MNKAESERIHELCERVAVEQDHKKFLELVQELHRLLSSHEDIQYKNAVHEADSS
jgi:hypothetical protein